MPGRVMGYVISDSNPRTFWIAVVNDYPIREEQYALVEHPRDPAKKVLVQVILAQTRNEMFRDISPAIPFMVHRGQKIFPTEQELTFAKLNSIGVKRTVEELTLIETLKTPPKPGQEVREALTEDLNEFFGIKEHMLHIGHLQHYEDIPVYLDPETLVAMHLGVLGATGSGKSYFAKVLVEELTGQKPPIPLVIFDPHGEYGELENMMDTRILEPDFLEGKRSWSNTSPFAVKSMLKGLMNTTQFGVLEQALTRMQLDEKWPPEETDSIVEYIQNVPGRKGTTISTVADILRRDKRLRNLDSGEPIDPDEVAVVGKATVIDFSGGVPLEKQQRLVGEISDLLFSAGLLRKEAFSVDLLVEEAHRYCPERGFAIGRNSGLSADALMTIATQGRKFGVGMTVVTQRPAMVSKAILSQCNTLVTFRLMSVADIDQVKGVIGNIPLLDRISYLAVGEAIILGVGLPVPFPIISRIRIRKLKPTKLEVKLKERIKRMQRRQRKKPTM